jgi:hypothetical protein
VVFGTVREESASDLDAFGTEPDECSCERAALAKPRTH